MVNLDRDREIELGAAVQAAKDALLALLTEDERKSRKATITDGRSCAWTFEDSAAKAIADESDPRRADLTSAMRRYQHAINAFWIYVHSSGAVEKLYTLWRSKHKILAKMVPREDVEAEILFQVRDVIRRWDPGAGTRFMTFAPRVLFEDLAEWIRLQTTAVRRPRAERRKNTEIDVPLLAQDRNHGGNQSETESDREESVRLGHPVHRQTLGDLSYTPDEECLLELLELENAAKSHKAL